MHPGFMGWWRAHRHGDWPEGAHSHVGCGRRGFAPEFAGDHARWYGAPGFESDPGSPFGVRRPLRFLAHKLGLRDEQVAQLASILDELKTERAQAAVDQRRRISALAEALEGSTFDEHKATTAGDEQVKSAQRVQTAVEHALRKIHAALDDEQRKKLAYLLRTGVLSL